MPPPPLAPEDIGVYSPEADDDHPGKRRALNVLAFVISWTIVALVGGALWALWTHLWLVPIIAVPLLLWAFVSSVTHP